MEPNRKEIELLQNQETDIISNLPDEILCNIISRLPTKNAIAASILSTKWKNISPFDYKPVHLDLDDSLVLQEYNPSTASFKAFMYKLLNVTLRDVSHVNSMILKIRKGYDHQDVLSWVSAVVSRFKIRDLRLSLYFWFTDLYFFQSLNGCVTLTTLQLGNCQLDPPEDFRLPSLKRLCLVKVEFTQCEDDQLSINEFIAGCPDLEFLWIFRCTIIWLRNECLSIRCPKLKTLIIVNTWSKSRRPKPCLLLDTPTLETWLYRDSVATGYFISSLKSLTTAYIDVCISAVSVEPDHYYETDDNIKKYDDYDAWRNDVCKIVAACSSTRRIYLSERCVIALHHPLPPSVQLPCFENLTLLSLGSVTSHGWLVLACLLCNAPKLELLRIVKKVKRSGMGYADFERLVPSPPICLKLHLKTIEHRGFEEENDEAKFKSYFWQNGKVLQNIVKSPDVAGKEQDAELYSVIRKLRVTNRNIKV